MNVRNKKTGKVGFIRCFNWEQGRELPVFVGTELEIWNQIDVELINTRIKKRKSVRQIKQYKDPFEAYTENELDALWESMSGYEYFKLLFWGTSKTN